ncbi:helix-turn-helix domain-containing protein [Roseicella aerolata]|uniref:HTH DNA binding domain-containing protein n=1 Tax=Roseicella aerolata TaxID=2883479 RepID=A0A9X1IIN4_9PROT|nr:helix-turn-helix domain-containing protein [Roseicella aerolata]MCB4825345.1 hypothetical protein [Roseicella aerolata]
MSEEHDPWRPAWEDDPTPEAPAPPWLTPSRARRLTSRGPNWQALIGPLAAAEDALSRLDASVEAASEPVREGLVARLAFAEAAGWLAAAAGRAWIHPRDLALAEAGLLGGFAAAALAGRGTAALPATAGLFGGTGRANRLLQAEADHLPDGTTLLQGLALARALRRLATLASWDPLASLEAATTMLQALEGETATPLQLRPAPFATWRREILVAPRSGGEPTLLAAAGAAANWMASEILDGCDPNPAQALLFAAAVVRRRKRLRAIPLPFWAMPPGGRPAVLPFGDPAVWFAAFLGRVAAAATEGAAELRRLRDAEVTVARLTTSGRQDLLPFAAAAALRAPAVTARGLASQLGMTPQGALLLLKRLQAAGILREVTGRRSFRAYAIN